MGNRLFNRLFWKISAIFVLMLVLFAAIALYISINAAQNYALELNQKLNRELAKNTVDVIKPEFKNETVNQDALNDIMHSMMVINPSVEVYLVDKNGLILSYVAPEKVVKLKEISLEPIRQFIKEHGNKIIYGDDPRNPNEKKIFSAAEVLENGTLTGYVYIVLASQEYESTAQMAIGSYILGISIRSVILILLISLLLGLVAIWYITLQLNKITIGIKLFQSGNYSTRINVKGDDEFDKIGVVFNEMAGVIERNIKELKGLDELRKELISNISHDLRTPVASIQGYAETLLLKSGKISAEEQTNYLETIYKSCEKLKVQVSELFELSRLQTNQVKLKPETFSIAELASDVANKYRIISQKKGISINVFVSKEIPLVKADISLIDRVLQNLIDNAVKFCKQGDYINVEIETQADQKVRVSIADSGAGINKDELPHIFERYYKSNAYQESTGLGLAIVKKIIDLHQSEINVSSQPGIGTTFAFHLPVAITA